jgi:hypothetical protein
MTGSTIADTSELGRRPMALGAWIGYGVATQSSQGFFNL